MKRLAVLIILMGVFQRVRWIERLRRKQSEKMLRIYKTRFYTGRIKIRNVNAFEVANVCIGRQGISIKIERLLLIVNYFKALRTWSLSKSLELRLTLVEVESGSRGYTESQQQSAVNAMNTVQRFEKNFYTAYRSMSRLFTGYIPQNITAEEIRIEIRRFGIRASFRSFNYSKGTFAAEIDLKFRNTSSKLAAENIRIHFKQARGDSKKAYTINFCAEIKGMRIHHRALSTKDFLVRSGSLDCNVSFSNSSFIIMDDSYGHVDEIPFSFYFSHEEKESDIIRFIFLLDVDLAMLLQFLPGLSLLSATNLGISGNLVLKFNLMFAISNPYEHFFSIDILENNIVAGDATYLNLAYLNDSFFHDIRKNGVFLRRILLDDSLSENYCTTEELPSKFPGIVIYAEDPGFYEHRGVDVFFAGYAIAVNIATRKFTRGGSTITMQLVRNLFLNHDKDLVRKVEEIIIALLIENIFRIPKSRLLEIYLNVIEFGPDIYGIKEASGYYFNKLPSEMTIPECMIITYIIPRPVHFYEALKLKTSQLNNNLKNYMQHMATGLLANATITQSEFDIIMKTVSERSVFSWFRVPGLAEKLAPDRDQV